MCVFCFLSAIYTAADFLQNKTSMSATKKRKASHIVSPEDAKEMSAKEMAAKEMAHARPTPSRGWCRDALRSGALLIPPLARCVFDYYGASRFILLVEHSRQSCQTKV